VDGSSGVEDFEKSKTDTFNIQQMLDDDNDDGVLMNPMFKQAGESYGTELVAFAKDTVKGGGCDRRKSHRFDYRVIPNREGWITNI
jgi:hypothetical protein